MKSAITWFARNPVAANLLMVLFIVGGIFLKGLEKDFVFARVNDVDGFVAELDELVYERTSSAVKAALTSLLEAPVPGASGRGRRKGARAASAKGNR